jgi:hypothetical protein
MALRRLSSDHSDVVGPNNHDANTRTASIVAFSGPLSRQCQPRVGLAEVLAHVKPAPGARVAVVMSVMSGIGVGGVRAN